MAFTYTGAIAAVPTPFSNDKINLTALEKHIQHLITGGLSGLVVSGTTGEAATLSDDERETLIRATREQVNGKIPIIAGTGTNNTRQSIERSKHAVKAGADALLLVVPYYNKPNQAGLVAHFSAIANSVDVPVILYNVPSRTSRSLDVSSIAKLAQIPNIIAVKDATGDLSIATRTLAETPDDFVMLSGDDATTMPFVAMGGHGAISVVANLYPKWMTEICRPIQDINDLRQRQKRNLDVLKASDLLFSDTNPIPIKTALHLTIENYPIDMRLPLVAPDTDAIKAFEKKLEKLNIKS